MATKLPNDAVEHYIRLGAGRSYAAVAEHFGVSKKTVTARAVAENWQAQVDDRERKALEKTREKTIDTLADINERHLKFFRAVQRKAIETLTRMPIDDVMDAVRALDIAVRNERLILGEPADRTAVDIETIIRREYDRWLVPEKATDAPR